jgi:hypothetical protein
MYRQPSGPSRILSLTVNVCDYTNDPTCDYNALSTDYSYFNNNVSLQVITYQMRPSNSTMGWNNMSANYTFTFGVDVLTTGDTTIRRDEFNTNTKSLGAIDVPGVTLVKYNVMDQNLASPTLNAPTNQTLFYYTFTPDIRVNQYTQQFTDLSGMLSYFFSISGVILLIYGFVFSHYTENMLNLSLA